MFVITVSAVKDIFEDMKRHNADNVENSRKVLRLRKKDRAFVDDIWRNLRVGQIVKIRQDEYFPADLILIKSSNPSGLAYIETKNLDGETNLKHKCCLKELHSQIHTPEHACNFFGLV